MAQSIVTLVDKLPANNVTTKVLTALDLLFPGEWVNFQGFDDAIRQITKETDPDRLQQIRDKAIALYDDPKNGYQSAVFLYQTVDRADTALGTAALADKIGEKIGLLGFLSKLTPKADTSQTIDLVLKISVEVLAYCKMNGMPKADPKALVQALQENYKGAALVRMGTLVCIDGLLPLGPDFLNKVHNIIGQVDQKEVQQNTGYTVLGSALPGENTSSKLGFLSENFEAVRGWMESWVTKTGVSRSGVFGQLGRFIEFADDNLDLVAAFLDQTTNYFTHTGIQSVATHVIQRAYGELQLADPSATLLPQGVSSSGDVGATTLQRSRPQLRHLQTGTVLEIPAVAIAHIGKPNPQYPPEIDLSRFPDSDVVSRLHANLWSDNGFEYYILDVGSSNGTFLNGALLDPKEKHPLRHGDRLDFGRGEKVSLIFEML
ncbi:FHA domain-containing protein [Synechococcus moorigangaii CMS01]|nr:FHA domain-containing protein [Synechococcus moorigangaii CMS01]